MISASVFALSLYTLPPLLSRHLPHPTSSFLELLRYLLLSRGQLLRSTGRLAHHRGPPAPPRLIVSAMRRLYASYSSSATVPKLSSKRWIRLQIVLIMPDIRASSFVLCFVRYAPFQIRQPRFDIFQLDGFSRLVQHDFGGSDTCGSRCMAVHHDFQQQ